MVEEASNNPKKHKKETEKKIGTKDTTESKRNPYFK